MKQDGRYSGEDQGSYILPVTNVNEQRRNFIGLKGSEQYYSLEDIRQGDMSGTTETDSKTHPQGSGGYTNINSKSGKPIRTPAGAMGKTVGKV